MKGKFFLILFFCFGFYSFADAAQISEEGCFIRENQNYALRVRMTSFDCALDFTGGVIQETYNITLYNLDPHYFTVQENGEDISATRTANELSFSLTLASNEKRDIHVVPWHSEDDDFYFVAISDTHDQVSVFEPMAQNIAIVNPPFITVSGDIIDGSDSDEQTNRSQYDEIETVLAELGNQYLFVPGNHDGQRIKNGKINFLYVFREYFGDTYYDFVFGNTLFLGLSTEEEEEEGKIAGEELTWVKNEFQTTDEENIITWFHRPLVLPSWNTATSFEDETNRQEVLNNFDDNGVDLAISGHIHTYEEKSIGDTLNQLITANAGYLARLNEDDYHFSLIHVLGDTITAQQIKTENFSTSVEYSGSNDGTEDTVIATLRNVSTEYLPYARVKFLLKPGDRFYVFDDQGNPLDFQSYNFGDMSVLYVKTSLEAQTAKNITVERSRRIHQYRENNVSVTGEVSFSLPPEDNSTALDFFIEPSDELIVNILEWDKDLKWQEDSEASVISLYTIENLSPERRYLVFRDGEIQNRYVADKNGTLVFTLQAKGERTLHIQRDRTLFPREMFMTVASLGSGQVRGYNRSGELRSSFFANREEGSFQSTWLDVDADGVLEIAFLGKGKLSLFTDRGRKIGAKKVLHKKGSLLRADFDADDKDEIIFVPQKKGEKVKIYSFNGSSWIFRAKFPRKQYSFALGDIDGNRKDEFLVSTGTKIMAYRLKKRKFKKIASQRMASEIISLGDTDADARKELLAISENQVRIFDFKNYFFRSKDRFPLTHSYESILLGDVTGDARDEIFLTSSGKVYIYREKDQRFQLVKTLLGFSPGTDMTFVDFNQDFQLELVLGEKTGGSVVRVFDPYELFSTFSGYAYNFTGGINLTKL